MKPRHPPLRLLSPIHRASRQVSTYLERRCEEHAVSPPEGHLLTYLSSYSPTPVGDLGRIFGLKGSTLTSMLDRLEERELLTRTANPDDRRSVLLELTPGGERIAAALRKDIEALETEVLRRLPARDLAGFQSVLDTLGAVTAVDSSKGEDR
jgi:DNA-binding MarR family transcriptional regulator